MVLLHRKHRSAMRSWNMPSSLKINRGLSKPQLCPRSSSFPTSTSPRCNNSNNHKPPDLDKDKNLNHDTHRYGNSLPPSEKPPNLASSNPIITP